MRKRSLVEDPAVRKVSWESVRVYRAARLLSTFLSDQQQSLGVLRQVRVRSRACARAGGSKFGQGALLTLAHCTMYLSDVYVVTCQASMRVRLHFACTARALTVTTDEIDGRCASQISSKFSNLGPAPEMREH